MDLVLDFIGLPLPQTWAPVPEDGYSIAFSAMTPFSRGTVRLASTDPGAAPLIDPNYLADERDVAIMRTGLEVARGVGRSPALAPYTTREALPGPETDTPSDVGAYLKRSLRTYFHYSCTCRMGTDPLLVVDPAWPPGPQRGLPAGSGRLSHAFRGAGQHQRHRVRHRRVSSRPDRLVTAHVP